MLGLRAHSYGSRCISACRSRRRAFTLLEVLLVVVILGLLVAMVIPSYSNHLNQARIDLAQQAVSNGGMLAGEIEHYRMRMGTYPETLADLTRVPEDAELRAKYGTTPFIKDPRCLRDPWGKDYQYKWPGDMQGDGFDLYSYGPDMQEGGDDDIGNWPTDTSP